MEKEILILGTIYKLIEHTKEEDKLLEECDGYCDYSTKQIVIDKFVWGGSADPKNPTVYRNKVIRHEIIHAYFYESGLFEQFKDEKIVDWIAMQFPKFARVFSSIEVDTL